MLAIVVASDLALAGEDGIGAGGFGLALLFAVLPVAIVAGARAKRLGVRAVVLAALVSIAAARCLVAPTTGTVLAGLALSFGLAVSLRTRRTFAPEAAGSALAAVGNVASRVSAALRGAVVLTARTKLGRLSLLPVLVPLALTAVFAGVFALANPVVAHALDVVGTALGSIVVVPSIGRVLVWAAALAAGATLLRPTIRRARGTEAAVVTGEAREVDLAIATNALVMLNLLFFAYDALDVAYLWSGSPPAGMRTQQYAHQGAFWSTVALALLTAVVGVMFRGALAHDPRAKRARVLAYAWCAQGLVLALGTYGRIGVHVAKSGLSDLRIVGVLGTSLVVYGVGLVAYKLHRRRSFVWLLRRQLDALSITLVLYAVLPTHLVAAHVNVARVAAGEYRPAMHMFRQARSEESAAAVLPLLDHPDVRIRQGVAALLDEERERLDAEADAPWRRRSLAATETRAVLDGAAPKIAAVLGDADPASARRALYDVTRVANEDRSLEEILAVPTAADRNAAGRAVY